MKGQSEVIGLMVIVVMLIFMGVIYLGFANLAESGSLASQRVGIETENALNALMNVDYEDKNIQELVVECGRGNGCNSLETALNDVYGTILRPGSSFSFWAEMEEEEIYAIETCKIGVVSSYVFVNSGVYYEVKLRLCPI